MKYTTEELKRFVSEIQEANVELSKWEEGFLESVAEQLDTRGTLSDRQVEILDSLYAEKTA